MKLLKFFAEWCQPCKMMDKTLEEVIIEFPDLEIERIDIEANKEKAFENGVMSIPTLLFLKDGVEVKRFVGVTGKSAIIDVLRD